jgi:hypothetical protein
MSRGFLDVDKIILPKSCADEAVRSLFRAGTRRVEGVALWAGVKESESTFHIKRTIIPKQTAGNIESGLIYVVEGDELHRISLELFDNGLQLIAQIHSHPGAAYHSETDDAYPIVTVVGGISIVVPNFAIGGVKLNEWAVYRLMPDTNWHELNEGTKEGLIIIVDDKPEKNTYKPFKFWPWR